MLHAYLTPLHKFLLQTMHAFDRDLALSQILGNVDFGSRPPPRLQASSTAHDLRVTKTFDRLVSSLNRFVAQHCVRVCQTRIASFRINYCANQSALSILVHHDDGVVDLVEFLNYKQLQLDDVQCDIECQSTLHYKMALTLWLPLCVWFPTRADILDKYVTFCSFSVANPWVLGLYMTSEFQTLMGAEMEPARLKSASTFEVAWEDLCDQQKMSAEVQAETAKPAAPTESFEDALQLMVAKKLKTAGASPIEILANMSHISDVCKTIPIEHKETKEATECTCSREQMVHAMNAIDNLDKSSKKRKRTSVCASTRVLRPRKKQMC